ncbi:hypothetical protein NA57DRAFT_53899 [Rhizodiscina lignyota]|uniref:PXMP2/4 family protein 3 n=1 Tax=Rhizodiscina lignyota TaxID=1504668 RepID=A0A9P4IL50_9PEZI|nr:hypothetical protein NA57DRAFT_53899 [Rhizodiscina lignyota]
MPSPMINATLQATAISAISNLLAQFIEAYIAEKPFSFDPLEFVRFLLCTVITAPPNYYWQGWLEKTWPGYEPGAAPTPPKDDIELAEKGDRVSEKEKEQHQLSKPRLNKRNTFTKWFVDCITLGAIGNTVAFLLIIGVLKGYDMAAIRKNIREETIPIIVAGYRIWPIASIISFTFIPWERRIVFFSVVGLFWGIYMSLISARL